MALGDSYASLDQLKDYLKIPHTKGGYDDALQDALDSSSREIERCCNRQFNKIDDNENATSRVYYPVKAGYNLTYGYLLMSGPTASAGSAYVHVDDFFTTDELVVRVFDQEWTSLEYELHPLNGIVDGQVGWPFYQIRAVLGPRFHSISWRSAPVTITARWGWDSVPAPIKQACLLMAAETFQLKDAPFGVAGMDAFGAPFRVRDTNTAHRKIAPYCKSPVLVG